MCCVWTERHQQPISGNGSSSSLFTSMPHSSVGRFSYYFQALVGHIFNIKWSWSFCGQKKKLQGAKSNVNLLHTLSYEISTFMCFYLERWGRIWKQGLIFKVCCKRRCSASAKPFTCICLPGASVDPCEVSNVS